MVLKEVFKNILKDPISKIKMTKYTPTTLITNHIQILWLTKYSSLSKN